MMKWMMKRGDQYGLQGGTLTKFNLLVKTDKDVQYKTAYSSGEGFFSVHWEIQHKSPEFVRLHVESPNETMNKGLNDLKVAIIKALIVYGFFWESVFNHLDFDFGKFAKNEEAQRRNKSTEVFKFKLNGNILQEDEFARIMFVDNILGLHVQEVLYQFGDEILGIFKE